MLQTDVRLLVGTIHDSFLVIKVFKYVKIKGRNIIGNRSCGSLGIRTHVSDYDST